MWHSVWPIFRVLVLWPVNLLESNLWTINLLDFIYWAITYATCVSSFIVFWVFLICILWKLLWLKTKVFLLQLLLVYQNHFYWLLWASNEFAYRTWLWHFQIFQNFISKITIIFKNAEKFQNITFFWRNLNFFEKSRSSIFWAGRAQIVEREVTGVNQYKRVCVYSNQPWIKYFIFWFYFIIFSLSNCIYFNCLKCIIIQILWIEVKKI